MPLVSSLTPPPLPYSEMQRLLQEKQQTIEMQDEENKDLRALVAMREEKIERVTALGELTTQAQKKKLKKERVKREAAEKEAARLKKLSYIPYTWILQWAILCWEEALVPFGRWLFSICSRLVDWLCEKMVDFRNFVHRRAEISRARHQKDEEEIVL